ncbi:MAG TPA: phenylalanine--tRNA ligase subunit alpha [Candidatus Norongarragalinales archaeon]|nr:phenylalanine--tRNA ligase subunit alpha [Candidatus Norongarragalinales archaeon]
MKEIHQRILSALFSAKGGLTGESISEKSKVPYASLMSLLSALEEEGLASVERLSRNVHVLTQEGRAYAEIGLPERRLADALGKTAVDLNQAFLKAGLSEAEQKIALVWAKKNGWIQIQAGRISLLSSKESPIEWALTNLEKAKDADVKLLLERKLVQLKEEKSVSATITPQGKKALRNDALLVSQLTPDMLKTGTWKTATFQPYDLKTVVAPVSAGAKHPYQEFLRKIREKLVGLGFQEEHGPLVELEFWNMDALFMAQDHPAREIHDVFFVEDPAKGEILDKELIQRVRKSHEEGLLGSKGWRYRWDPEIAARLVLRSQTTAVSARVLSKKITPPLRMFSIGRVFRPDEIDWKHFIEFNQCEGIVVDKNMSFRELLGYLKRFAIEVFGAEDVKFQPSYFPFTEPSVELYAKIPGRGWAEVGGAGMFRPEMLSALGVDVPVLAWGLGIDRLAMLSLGINDVRDLFSPDLAFLKERA